MHIVLAMSNAPLAYPIPPSDQGGTEKVFHDLAEALVRKGHRVCVFAPKGSSSSAKVIEYPPHLQEEDIGKFVARHMPANTDIINDFTFSSAVKRCRLPVPAVSTHQCALGWFTDRSIFPSQRMRNSVNQQKGYIVYNGIRPGEYEYSNRKKGYLLFIGRIVREKGVLEAIYIARNTNRRLVIAGPIKDEKLFCEEIEPLLRDNANLEYVGPVGGKRKQDLLKNAMCVLFPITWEEPFGIVMIEAMMTGTPVLAFNRGAVPEVMAGFPQLICHHVDEMMHKVANPAFPASRQLRQYAVARFSSATMANRYTRIYRSIIGKKMKRRKPAMAIKPALRKRRPFGKQINPPATGRPGFRFGRRVGPVGRRRRSRPI